MHHSNGMQPGGGPPLEEGDRRRRRASPLPAVDPPFAVWTAAPDGRFVTRQPDWQRYTSQPWEAHRDHGWLEAIHPEDREGIRRRLDAPEKGPDTIAFFGRIRSPSGAWRHFMARALAVRGEEGSLQQWSGTIVDVEDTWTPHRRLHELAAQLRGILEHSPALVFIKDLAGRYVLASRSCAEVMGLAPEELIGRTDEEVWPDVAEGLRVNDRRVIEEGRMVEEEELARTPKGDRLFLSTKFPLLDADGRRTGVARIATDVTDRRRALEQVRIEVERRDQFLAMLSHELRNPVHAAQGALAVAQQGADDTGGGQPLEVIGRQLDYLADILQDLLEVSRVTRGKISMHFETSDLREAVDRGVEMTEQLARRKGITVRRHCAEDALCVRGDRARMAQIVGNLVNNAVRFSSSGQEVDVRAWREGDTHWLEVVDRGLGLSDDDHRGMFELFYQGESSLDRSRGGLGVGLTLVRTIAEQHGARIEVSGAPGEGATFRVGFPAVEGRQQDRQAETEERAEGEPLRLFLVEDNEDARTMLRLALERRGHQVQEAATGEEGLEGIPRARPHVAIVDIGLPGLDGYELARRLRRDVGVRDIPLIALTGYGRAEDRRAALEAGFDAHLTKPLAPRDLDRILGELGLTGDH